MAAHEGDAPFQRPADVESVTIRYLMYVLLPAWFVPAVADYLMHRRTRIERTSQSARTGT